MSDKETKVVEETTEETKVEPAPEPVEVPAEEKTEEKSSSQSIDYKAQMEAEKERADKLQQTIASHASKERRDEREEEVPEEDKPPSRKEVEAMLSQGQAQNQRILQETMAIELARKLATSEEEAQATVTFWKSRVVPTDNLEEDIKSALAILNRDKLVSENSELRRSLGSKDTKSTDAGSSHRDEPEREIPKVPAEEAAAYRAQGFKWDGTKKLWTKPIKDGKDTLFINPSAEGPGRTGIL